MKSLKFIDDKNNFRDAVKSIVMDQQQYDHSHYIEGDTYKNLLISLHKRAAEEKVYGESLFMRL